MPTASPIMTARIGVVLDSLTTDVSARSVRSETATPTIAASKREQAGGDRAEADQQDDEGDEDADDLRVAGRARLGDLPPEVHRDAGRLGRTARAQQGVPGGSRDAANRHRVGHRRVGDPPVLRDRPRLEGIGHQDDLRVLAQLRQRVLDRLLLGGCGQRLAAPGPRTPPEPGCRRFPGNFSLSRSSACCDWVPGMVNELLRGCLTVRARRGDRDEHHEPGHQHQGSMAETPSSQSVEPRSHALPLFNLFNRAGRSGSDVRDICVGSSGIGVWVSDTGCRCVETQGGRRRGPLG